MKKKKKRNWLKRAAGIVCAAVMASSVVFVNINSASRTYASDVSTEDTDTAVSSEDMIADGTEIQTETNEISAEGEQQEAEAQASDDEQRESVSAEENQNESAIYEGEQQANDNISSEKTAEEDKISNSNEISEEAADTNSKEANSEAEITYSYQIADKGITVNAVAPNGSLPDGAVLLVTPVDENTESYNRIEKKLDEKADSESYNVAGFLAYDIAFTDADGNEIEPSSGNVKVSFSYEQGAIPDAVKDNAAQNAQIKVLHFVEDESGNVTDIVDLTDSSSTSVTTTANNEIQSLSFETESFSYFGLQWINTAADEALGTVETIDSSDKITMKMINYPSQQFSGAKWSTTDPNVKQGLLSNTLSDDGYPTFATHQNKVNDTDLYGSSLGQFFDNYSGGMTSANHLFLESAYKGNDGIINDPGTYYYDSGYNGASYNVATGNFTVYNFLTTIINDSGFWAHRGNFLPYNTFNNHNAATGRTNEYDSQGNKLSETDPMYGKTLYLPDQNYVDYWFGMELDAAFAQPKNGLDDSNKNMTFEFTGDDDMWVYIDGVLVLDIGGCHDARSGSIDFATGEVKVQGVADTTLYKMFAAAGKTAAVKWNSTNTTFADYTTHTIKVFYMERGAGASNLRLKFNLQLVENYNADFTVEKTFTGITQEQIDSIKNNISYTLKAYNTDDSSTEATDAPYDNTVLKLTDSNVTRTEENGSIKYTWKLSKCSYKEDESYVYRVEESGGNLSGYTYELTKSASATGATVYDDASVLIARQSDGTDISAKFSLVNVYRQNDPSGGDDEDAPEIEHTKTIKADTENPEQYELSLDAKGYVKTPEDADIVLVVDKSGSMSENSKTSNLNKAINIMKQELTSYVNQWRDEDKPDINLSVVEFSSGVTTGARYETDSQTEWNASSSIARNWTALSDFSYGLTNPTGGTNWQAGILTAEKLMSQKANDNHKKYVIILTDGNPTFRYSKNGGSVASNYADSSHFIYGTGNTDNNGYNYNAALNQWKASANLKNSRVYVVQVDSSASKCKDFVKAIYPDSGDKYSSYAKWMDGTSETSLTDDFKTIAKEITHGIHFTDVTIHDTLSENVKFAETNPTVKVYKVDENGNEEELDASKYTLNVTENTVDVSFNIDKLNYLEDGYTYRVKFKVVAKTDKGVDALITGNGTYGNTGDEGTDAKGNDTSSNKDGLWSNDSVNTYVNYTVNNKTEKKEYKKPVVQINTVSASVTKVWKCKYDSEKHDAINASIKAYVYVDSSGNTITDKRDITSEVFASQLKDQNIQSLSDDNSWTYKWSYLPKYYHYMNDGNDAAAVIEYTVSEPDVPDGYECEVTYTNDPDDQNHTIWTITNTEILANLDLKKTDYNGSKYLDSSVFTLEKKDESTGTWSDATDYEIKNGDADIELKDIQKGYYRLYEKTAPKGYSILADKIYFKAYAGIITLTDENGAKISDNQKMWTLSGDENAKVLTIKNCEIYSLPESGSFGIYPFTIGGVAVIATALLLFIKNKQKEDA